MNKFPLYATLLTFSSIACLYHAQANPLPPVPSTFADSVGVEKKDGKRFILHRVDEGQTLYAVSRRYGRSVPDIKAANPDMSDALRYGQLIRIPIPDGALSRKEEKKIDKAIRKQEKEEKREAKADEKATEVKSIAKSETDVKKADDPARAGIHVVEPGQTLYSLGGRYNVSQSDLRKWNNLSGNNVLIGQALIVSEKAYLDRTPSATQAASVGSTGSTSPATSTDAPGKTTTATKPPVSSPAEPHASSSRPASPSETKPDTHTERPTSAGEATSRPSASTTKPAEAEVELPRPGNDAPMPIRGRRISSSGVAEMIDGADGSGKYLALHRTAPVGTLLQVRNEFNNQSLWVKVIGRLPNTGVNDKILIKLSTQAFTKLSPEDRRFRAEVSYIAR